MCICCCICNCCNSYSSKCIELCVLVLSSITFICSFLGFLCIKISHLTTLGILLLVLLMVFSTFITISAIFITIFRFKGIINKNKNTISTYLALISLILVIFILLISFVAESLIQTNFKNIDYPCKDLSLKNDPNIIVFRLLSLELKTKEERSQFCKNKNMDYNAKICSNLEYTMSYLTSTIIEICSLLLCFFWYNDYRRIKERIDGELPLYDSTYINKRPFANDINYREGGESGGPSDRYLNKNNNLAQSNMVFVNNKNNKINSNNKKDSGSNFIKNLRKEMEEGIESIEDDSSENKEDENKKNEVKQNYEDKLYSEKSDKDDKSSNNNNNNNNNDNNDYNSSQNNNIIIVENENSKNESNIQNIEQKDISIYKDINKNKNEIFPK